MNDLADRRNLDERFTDIADWASEIVGRWWWTAISAVLVAAWFVYGAVVIGRTVPDWFSSTQFGIPINDVTTIGEWFMEGLIAAAANRIEARNHELQANQERIIAHNAEVLDAMNAAHARNTEILEIVRSLVEKEESEIEEIEAVLPHGAKGD